MADVAYALGMELPFLRGTKGRILRLLRRGTMTADEIADPLDVTPNGVRFHLTELERDGLVEQRSVRRGPRKPSHGYSLTQSGDALFPKSYDALSNAILADVRAERGPGEVEALFRRMGHGLAARHAHRFAALPPDATAGRAGVALEVLEELGAVATLTLGGPSGPSGDAESPGNQHLATVAGLSCPFKAVVPDHPEACRMLEAFLASVLPYATVRESCEKGATPHCRFEVSGGAL
ncbi:MAG: hypothetical protein AVDCRST_MAG77-5853 [uncultured Chloroflexi bacterium]|uniref:HTH arsR-type domain-containing protein n=1 Tax=uncultured Chloroflexota bacterium TaxID=166587 RepID=A0A6J4KE74_9CHLR|nr:MAG: hypothetical protein AVDCRST_MAG77-5853 [uncultured Chloroflexota bacterium]